MNCLRCDTPVTDKRNRVLITSGKRLVPQHILCPRAGVEQVRVRQAHLDAEERQRRSS